MLGGVGNVVGGGRFGIFGFLCSWFRDWTYLMFTEVEDMDLAKWSQHVIEAILKSIVSVASNRINQTIGLFRGRIRCLPTLSDPW